PLHREQVRDALRCSGSPSAQFAFRSLLVLHLPATATTRLPLTSEQPWSFVLMASRETCLRLPHHCQKFDQRTVRMPRSYAWPRRKASVKNVMNSVHCHKAGNAIAAGLSAAGGNDLVTEYERADKKCTPDRAYRPCRRDRVFVEQLKQAELTLISDLVESRARESFTCRAQKKLRGQGEREKQYRFLGAAGLSLSLASGVSLASPMPSLGLMTPTVTETR